MHRPSWNRRCFERFVIAAFTVVAVIASSPCLSTADEEAPGMPPHAVVSLTEAQVRARLELDSDKTLAVKQFDPAWIGTLTERGEPVVYTRENSADFEFIGMPVGGICTGQLYLGGDGKLWYWDIFNTKSMRDTNSIHSHRNPYRRSQPDDRAQHRVEQGFALRIHEGDGTVTRTLDRDGFQDIEFRGQYPIGTATYEDADLPVRVELEAFSPFVPLNLDDSTFPATIMSFEVTNTSDRLVVGKLVGWLENAVCIRSRQGTAGKLSNRIVRKPGLTMVTMSAAEPDPVATIDKPRPEILFEDFEMALGRWTAEGTAFEGNPKPNFHHQPLQGHRGKGLADSFRNGGDSQALAGPSDGATGKLISKAFTIERKAIRFLIGGGDHPRRTCMNLVVDGKIVRSAVGKNSETLAPHVFDVTALQGKTARLEIVDQHTAGWGHVLVDHIVFSDDTRAAMKPLDQLLDYGSMALALLGDRTAVKATASFDPPNRALVGVGHAEASFADPSPVGALGRWFTLEPGEKVEVCFILSWYFPNAPRFPIATAQGRHYGTRFANAGEVAERIAARYDELATQTRLWRDTWYDSTLPWWFLDRTFLNTSILATNTCYLFRDGRFYGYEGVYHGHGTCTHVWGYVQAPGRLFPVLEQRLREMVDYEPRVSFDASSGRIAYRSEANRGDAVDGQSGCIMRTYLTHQMQPDDAFLRRVYPVAKKAMNYLTSAYDADRDGVLTGGQHNTLDARWYGKITWLSLHYTGALRAMAAMSDEMGNAEYAAQCRRLADRGRGYIETKLWGGEYFFHEADPQKPDSPGIYDGLEYSQLLGQSWAYQVGLGRILDPDKVATHLASLWKYNFTTDVGPFREKYENGRWYAMPGEGGTIACTWPHGGDEALQKGHRHFAGYLNECQPGYEWAATSLWMWHDMPYRALAHTRTMHDRYHASKRNPWNEVEWGDHYSRSMASYGVFTAACGFEYHGPKGYLAFSPRIHPENFKAAFTSAEGWGTFAQTRDRSRQTETITVRWGTLRVRTMAFDLPVGARVAEVVVATPRGELAVGTRTTANRIVVSMREPLTLAAGERLSVTIPLQDR